MYQAFDSKVSPNSVEPALLHAVPHRAFADKNWFAVYTHPRHEKSCERQLSQRGLEVFLPTYFRERVWKNRQHVKVELPLFTSYLFVRIGAGENAKVLQAPGVLRVLGNGRGPEPIPEAAIKLLRSDQFRHRIEPNSEIDVGQRVRIRTGAMEGVEGVLIRKKSALWFVLSIDLINQRAMVQVQAHEIETVVG